MHRNSSGVQQQRRGLAEVLFTMLQAARLRIQDVDIGSFRRGKQQRCGVLRYLQRNDPAGRLGVESPTGQALMRLQIEHPDLTSALLVAAFCATVHGYVELALAT